MIDKIDIHPTGTGPHGKFWEVDVERAIAHIGGQRDQDGTVTSILVEAPYAHPIWHSYWLFCTHLRPIIRDGKPLETKFYLESATHELWLMALAPDKPRQPQIISGNMQYLTPKNFGAQFIAASDGMARDRVLKTAEDIVDGKLNPDTDYIKWWAERWGTNMLKAGWDSGTKIILGDQTIAIPPAALPKEMN
jgi:hypothetical protein